MRWLVGAVGIELKATLKARKLLIPRKGKFEKNSRNAEPRYTPGTRRKPWQIREQNRKPHCAVHASTVGCHSNSRISLNLT